jgi:hypothetical protein
LLDDTGKIANNIANLNENELSRQLCTLAPAARHLSAR